MVKEDTWIWYSFGSWNHFIIWAGSSCAGRQDPYFWTYCGPLFSSMADAFEDLIEAKVLRILVATAGSFFWGLHGVGMPPVRVVRCYAAAKRFQKLGGIIEYHMFPNIFIYTLHTVSQSQEDEHQLYKIGMILKFKSRHFSLSQFVKI